MDCQSQFRFPDQTENALLQLCNCCALAQLGEEGRVGWENAYGETIWLKMILDLHVQMRARTVINDVNGVSCWK